jgi:hypothetical protein
MPNFQQQRLYNIEREDADVCIYNILVAVMSSIPSAVVQAKKKQNNFLFHVFIAIMLSLVDVFVSYTAPTCGLLPVSFSFTLQITIHARSVLL